jgi:hypothetical protein
MSGLFDKEMSVLLTGIELTSLSLHVFSEQPRFLSTGSTVTSLRLGVGQTLGHNSLLASRYSAKSRKVKVDGTCNCHLQVIRMPGAVRIYTSHGDNNLKTEFNVS